MQNCKLSLSLENTIRKQYGKPLIAEAETKHSHEQIEMLIWTKLRANKAISKYESMI